MIKASDNLPTDPEPGNDFIQSGVVCNHFWGMAD
jgi:hypothetical protein